MNPTAQQSEIAKQQIGGVAALVDAALQQHESTIREIEQSRLELETVLESLTAMRASHERLQRLVEISAADVAQIQRKIQDAASIPKDLIDQAEAVTARINANLAAIEQVHGAMNTKLSL